jgi:hypothetical protein
MGNRPHLAPIHILDDDSLVSVFCLYRKSLLGEDEDDEDRNFGGEGRWLRRRWWYPLAHVCQRWRNLILGSAYYLGVSLACTRGTPVADMLAHSLPFPLVVNVAVSYITKFTPKDEENIILALTVSNVIASVVATFRFLVRFC